MKTYDILNTKVVMHSDLGIGINDLWRRIDEDAQGSGEVDYNNLLLWINEIFKLEKP